MIWVRWLFSQQSYISTWQHSHFDAYKIRIYVCSVFRITTPRFNTLQEFSRCTIITDRYIYTFSSSFLREKKTKHLNSWNSNKEIHSCSFPYGIWPDDTAWYGGDRLIADSFHVNWNDADGTKSIYTCNILHQQDQQNIISQFNCIYLSCRLLKEIRINDL